MGFSLTYATHKLDKPILVALDTTGTASPVHEPGYTVRSDDGREWQYVQNDSSDVAAVAGGPAVIAQDTDGYVVTPDVSDAGSNGAGVRGAYMSVLTDQYYGWIQTKGKLVDAPCSTNVAAGNPLYAEGDGMWGVATVGTTEVNAGALEDDTAGFADIVLL
jgi:hypothetical protein